MLKSIICITGGIASGKSFVANQLKEFGLAVIDADVIARQIVKKGSECLEKLVVEFGSVILNPDRTLNRNTLKQIVFKDPQKIKFLNQLTHPLIDQEIKQQIKLNHNTAALLVIPLFDSKMIEHYKIDRVLVVDVGFDTQVERVQKRDGVDGGLAKEIINSQISRKGRLEMATDVIVNNGSIRELSLNCDKFATLIGI